MTEKSTRKHSALLDGGDSASMFGGEDPSTEEKRISNKTRRGLKGMAGAGKADGPTARKANRLCCRHACFVLTEQARPVVSISQQRNGVDREMTDQAQLLSSADIYFSPVDATGGSVGLSSPLDIPKGPPTQ